MLVEQAPDYLAIKFDELLEIITQQTGRTSRKPTAQDLVLAGYNAALAKIQMTNKNAERYLFLRDQNIFDQIGSTSPYVVRGQSMEQVDGKELDDLVDAAMK